MLVCKLSDQLGNQMFAYAAVKTIAKDKGFDFHIFNQYDNQFLKNDIDKTFGCNLTSVFENIQSEIIHHIPAEFHEFQEITTRFSPSSLQKEALEVKDNTLMRGHYISPLYFMHRLDEVKTWFEFPESIDRFTSEILIKIRTKYPPHTKFCSVHFRNALDYRLKGFMLSKRYWEDASQRLLQQEKNIVFLVFYDKMTRLVQSFIKKHPSEIIHNSLFEDFNLISKCDYHIVCNSSFSIMAALMDKKSLSTTFCPSIWPVPKGYFPTDSYPKEWIKILSKRNRISFIMGYITPLLSPLKYLIVRK